MPSLQSQSAQPLRKNHSQAHTHVQTTASMLTHNACNLPHTKRVGVHCCTVHRVIVTLMLAQWPLGKLQQPPAPFLHLLDHWRVLQRRQLIASKKHGHLVAR